MNRHTQKGVALVITLIMLSVVTFMAITFLALSRRERSSVSVTTDQTTANMMADAALARAEAEILSRMASQGHLLAYDYLVSTNFINPNGFISSMANATNVSYFYPNNNRLSEADHILNIANLWVDPRPPVFISTNSTEPPIGSANQPMDFRFYVDFNRNGMYEPSGYFTNMSSLPRMGNMPSVYDIRPGNYAGDPEWIGMLEKPQYPHSGTNKFLGRYAYIVLPSGKSLDLNFIHNQAKRLLPKGDGFNRNQGVGSWEINLAAFLKDLNTNMWTAANGYNFITNLNQASRGLAIVDAADMLVNRSQGGGFPDLPSAQFTLGASGAYALANNSADDYSDGPQAMGTTPFLLENDNPNLPWPGSDSYKPYSEIQDLFRLTTTVSGFNQRINGSVLSPPSTPVMAYNRYTFYRLLSQMGVDSEPVLKDKIHINFAGSVDPNTGTIPGYFPWNAGVFFTNTADRLLRSQFGMSITNIPIYPTNLYSSAVHRLLQLAANIYDSTTNRTITGYPHMPSVFRPMFANDKGMIYINGFIEETNSVFLNNPWLDLRLPNDRGRIAQRVIGANANIFGIPIVIGAKKGFPNFNECSLQTAVQLTRKLEVRKPSVMARPISTNQMYILGVSNIFGVEAWNSYSHPYPRPVDIRITNLFTLALTNRQGTFWSTNGVGIRSNIQMAFWPGNPGITNNGAINSNSFVTITNRLENAFYLTNSIYTNPPAGLTYLNPAFFTLRSDFLNPTNHIGVVITNRMVYLVIDRPTQRIIDFVNYGDLVAGTDLTAELLGNQSFQGDPVENMLWDTYQGVTNQIQIALGNINVSDATWTSYSQDRVSGLDKEKSIDRFRVFLNLTPLRYRRSDVQQEIGNALSMQVPFTPSRKLSIISNLQVNDPLVHYTLDDMYDYYQTNNIQAVKPVQGSLPPSNLGQLNRRYRPWGGNPNVSSDTNDFNFMIKDPMVRRSDDWNFPTNRFPNIGWLGRVHRGTPWQTMYMKDGAIQPRVWLWWAGNVLTHPTNDWRILDLFTTAANANAASGLLSVNQTNLAAWSAVLSEVPVLLVTNAQTFAPTNVTPVLVKPSSPELQYIVDSINYTRSRFPGGVFMHMGDILASPGLTTMSPFVQVASTRINDETYERIPQQIMSLLKADEPRVVIYTFGQTLAPAGTPVINPGTRYHQMYTNYQVVAEVWAKHVLRVEGTPQAPIFIKERFQYLPNE